MTSPAPSSGFVFRTVAAVLCGVGRSADLHDTLAGLSSGRNVVIVTDAFIAASAMLHAPVAALAQSGWNVTVLDGVIADPPEAVVLALAEQARAARADVVIGWGGGSSMDAAKVVALLLGSNQPVAAMYGIGNATGPRLPLLQVPTTAGTGSEVTPISILTVGETTKSGIVSSWLYADVVVLDAALTVGLPPAVTAATAIDAMVHAIEAFTSARLKNPLSDHCAIQALHLLVHHFPAVMEHGADLRAREAMLLGAMLAGQAFANAPVAAVHALAYPIGGRYHVPHGLSNALMLPHVMRFNMPACVGLYAELARTLNPAASVDDASAAQELIDRMVAIIDDSGIPKQLRDVGIEYDMLPTLAEDAMGQTRLLLNNPRPLALDDAVRLYQEAY